MQRIVHLLKLPFRMNEPKKRVGTNDFYRYPDFYHTGKRKVIEVYDSKFSYWGKENRDEEWEAMKKKEYEKLGYECLCIDARTTGIRDIAIMLIEFS